MVRVNRALRYVNAVAALVLLAALAAAYWIFWRPMPQTSGATIAGVSAPVTISRDSIGVPHIKAATIEDALFAQGYVTAQDRLWQMDAIRRLASGELAEIIGPVVLETDRDARRLRLRRAAEDHVKTMPAADRALLAAYARGVNEYIETHRTNLPPEFRLLRYQPRPWSMADSVVIALHMYRILTTTWKEEVEKAQMMDGGDPAKVNELYPARTGREIVPGSNAWAIAGNRTSTGKPILANDPHLEYAFPSTWYQVHMEGGPLNVIGVSLPGVPAVVIGHNQRIAWGVTNLGFDVQDLYIEKLDPNTGRYLFRGNVEQAKLETERIAVKDESPQTLQIWVTRHGGASIADRGRLLSLRWVATESGVFQFPLIELNLAKNWTEFRAALKKFPGPGQNFVYADTDGNIGYQAAGVLPVRKNYDGDIPVDGASGDFEWSGYIPFEELPSAYNPASGVIVTANQNPWPVTSPARVSGQFAPPYRSAQIDARLRSKTGWKPEEMLAIQTDVYSAFSQFVGKCVASAWEQKKQPNSSLAPAIEILKQWNGQMDKNQAAPLIATLTYQHLRRAIAEKASPKKNISYDYEMAPAVVEKLLRERPAGWFTDWNAAILQAFSDAIEEGNRIQGNDPSKWRWGVASELKLAHPVLSRIPWAGKYFQLPTVFLSGSSTTVKQTTRRLGPSMRFVADLADWDRSLNNLTIGQSDHFFSGHFKDQWSAYLNGTSFPMQFGKIGAKDTLTLAPRR